MNKRKKSMSSRIEDIMYYTLEAALKTRNSPLIVLSLIPTLILFLVLCYSIFTRAVITRMYYGTYSRLYESVLLTQKEEQKMTKPLLAMTAAQVGLTTRFTASQLQRIRDLKSTLLKAKYDKRYAAKHPELLQLLHQELAQSIYKDVEFPGLQQEELDWQSRTT